MATISLSVNASLVGSETLETSESPAAGGGVLSFNGYNVSAVNLGGSTTPAVDVTPVDLSDTLAGATKDFDLTAAPPAKDIADTVDLTGKKLIALLMRVVSGNAAGVALAGQGANAYDLFGPSGQVTVYPGGVVVYSFLSAASQLPTVGAGAKDVRLTGTAADVVQAIAYFGTP